MLDGAALPPGSGGGEISLLPGMVGTNFAQLHAFSISEMHIFSTSRLQLDPGGHTLQVVLFNEGTNQTANPAAFNVSAANISVHTLPTVRHPVVVFHR
jgi:hypothetical protein